MNFPMNRPVGLRLGALVLLICSAGSGAGVVAQAPPQSPQSPPSVTFQTEVNYVDVDAIVTDQQRNFVSGLSRDDFELFEDGKPQKIDTFSLVDIPLERADRFLVMNKPVTTDVRSNRQVFAGRVYVIVLDDMDVSFMRSVQVKRAAHEFVERYFGANDMAAVVYTSGRTDATQEFTGDSRLLLAAIDKFAGQRLRSPVLEYIDKLYQNQLLESSTSDPSSSSSDSTPSISPDVSTRTQQAMQTDDLERQFRATGVLGTLKNVAEFLSTVRGRRKAMLLFSEGIDYPINDVFGTSMDTTILRQVQDAITAAARANVNFFTIDPRGLVGMTTDYIELAGGDMATMQAGNSDPQTAMNGRQMFLDEMRISQNSLRTLADETGGFAAINKNSFSSAFDRIVQANSRYYVMGYYPPTHPRDGKFHKIQVRVKRPGLTVVARKGYGSPRGKTPEEKRRDDDAKRAADSKKGGADNTSPQLRDALNSPMQQAGLTFSVQAAPFRGADKKTSVALAIEIDGAHLRFTPQNNNAVFADKIELSLFSINEQAKPQDGIRSEVDLTLKPETYQRVQAVGLRLNPRVSLAPGRYQVRVGVRESGGAVGSVFYDLQVPDFSKEPLMMSGMLITAASAQIVPTAQADPLVAKMLPGPVTARREFSQNDILAVLAEIYDNISSQQPRQIDTSVRLLADDGREVFAARDSVQNGSARNWTAYGYTRDIPLKDIPPGRYLLRVEAQVRGNTGGAKPAGSETVITVVQGSK
jgi:VWFA-related protein